MTMSDEQIEPRPLAFTQHTALTVDEWLPMIEVTDAMLKQAYLYGATVDGDTLRFAIGNGEATYTLRRGRKHGRGFVAELIESNAPANLKSRKKKYEVTTE